MKTELTPEMFDAIAKAAQVLTDGQATQLYVNQQRICDHCKSANREAFPYHVYDSNGEFWEDLCNQCFDELGCAYPDDGDPPDPDQITIGEFPVCSVCGAPLEREDCWNGCDDGYFDMYDEDPLLYEEGDVEVCNICRGRGSYWVCPNAQNHPASEAESEMDNG
ncbi:MAG: hypothetical protein U0350_36485 [Caldilineaceae bacterium]